MKTNDNLQVFFNNIKDWASTQPDVKAIALVGSYANDTATDDSDIDLIMLVYQPDRYLKDTNWVSQFGSVNEKKIEHYGKVTSIHVWYSNGREVEFGITNQNWVTPPLDDGTQQVINNGMKVLFEREALLSAHLRS
jgi:predicted nucleotidyltransferase